MEPQITPAGKVHTTPRDFFLHLGIIVGLYVSIVSLVSLIFQIIDYAIGDNISYYGNFSEGMRMAIASLIIFFPAYIFLGWLFNRDLKTMPEKKFLGIRRWLVYLTLFIAGLTMVIDLVVLINSFLGGEITASFFYKVLTILVVVGMTFAYYIMDIRQGLETHTKLYRNFGLASIILVLASIIFAFIIVGTPMSQRAQRFDEIRISDIQRIQYYVTNYWEVKNNLPGSLKDIEEANIGLSVPVDPETGESYEYSIRNEYAYDICAVFSTSNKLSREKGINPRNIMMYDQIGNFLVHDAGRVCFTGSVPKPPIPTGKN